MNKRVNKMRMTMIGCQEMDKIANLRLNNFQKMALTPFYHKNNFGKNTKNNKKGM